MAASSGAVSSTQQCSQTCRLRQIACESTLLAGDTGVQRHLCCIEVLLLELELAQFCHDQDRVALGDASNKEELHDLLRDTVRQIAATRFEKDGHSTWELGFSLNWGVKAVPAVNSARIDWCCCFSAVCK